MKKFIFMAAALLVGTVTVSAQDKQYKPEAMDFSLEMNYAPGNFIGISNGSSNAFMGTMGSSFTLPEFGLKGRFFVTDRLAVKLNLGFNSDSNKTNNYVDNGDNSETVTETKDASTTFSIMPGIEYHLGNFNRVSPYVGAAIGISTGSDKDTGATFESKSPVFGLGINVSAGVDVYICQGLYAGVELGLGYGYEKHGRGTETSIQGNTTTTADGDTETMTSNFGFYATPSLRIGWFF